MTAPTTTDHRRAAHRLWNVAALMLAATMALPVAALACADALQPGNGPGVPPLAGPGGGGSGPGGGDGERRPERGGRPGERGGPNGQDGRVGEPPSPQQVRANLQRLAERLKAAQGRLEK